MAAPHRLTRREYLLHALCAGGALGLRALLTGIPPAILAQPRRALAQAPVCAPPGANQFLVLSASANGDPINANAPGSYIADSNVMHPQDPAMASTAVTLGTTTVQAAKPWAQLGPAGLGPRTCFFHHASTTVVHAEHPQVMRLMGRVAHSDMLVSALSTQLAPCLGTIQTQPVCLSTGNASEALSYQGLPQPQLSPSALSAILAGPQGAIASLRSLRDQTLDSLSVMLKAEGNAAQAARVDAYVLSQTELRSVSSDLIASLASINDNSVQSQISAAIILIRMKLAPVLSLHIPFGGDNHSDALLAGETAQCSSGVASIIQVASGLVAANLQDSVTFGLLNVFGRTMSLALKGYNGRDHNGNHSVGMIMGAGVAGGVVGGVTAASVDYSAQSINPSTGGVGGSIAIGDTLASYGRTLGAACGLNSAQLDAAISGGQTVTAALAP